jgi:8-oxo-dGTP diphosphatase
VSDDTDQRFVINCAAAVYRDGEYLLGERAATEAHAAGEVGLLGGTVEADGPGRGVLAATVRRELREEVGVEVDAVEHVASGRFVSDTGTPVVNVVFLARHAEGTPHPREPDEVAAVHWIDADEIDDCDDLPPYTRRNLADADDRRRELDW